MFALGVRYLLGRVVATHPASRERVEWPPHPDRVFMALVAAYAETGQDEQEKMALQWLESLSPPELVAGDFLERSAVTAYVPVNDSAAPRMKAGNDLSADQPARGRPALLPESRPRQPRQFPTASLLDPNETVYLRWHDSCSPEHLAALAALCRKVTYIGHSSSLVQCWLETAQACASLRPQWTPNESSGRIRLRITARGRFEDLLARYEAGLRPASSTWTGYDKPPVSESKPSGHTTCFDQNLVILRQNQGPKLPLSSTIQVMHALRGAIMKNCPQPLPEWISGHAPNGAPSEEDHLALFPLPHVGRKHADGRLHGLAMSPPRNVPLAEQSRCWQSLLFNEWGEPRELCLKLGPLGEYTVQFDDREHRPIALQPETWTGLDAEARQWATVTPICFDRHPKGAEPWAEVEAAVIAACERIGLTGLVENVVLSPVSLFMGAPPNVGFPNLQRKAGGNIHHTHAVIAFKEPVTGPVLLGAGRYRGYGLCRPVSREPWS